jgi:bis(5'-adenosyl)-triphosphatase
MNCPFCLPIVLKASFAESDNFRAIYNLAPVLPGHVLIVPKLHICSFLELNDDLTIEMVKFSREIITALMNAFKCESFDWTIQDGKPAGQTIEHLHMHIIPRFTNDMPDPGDWYPAIQENELKIIDSYNRPKLSDAQLEQIIQKLACDFKGFFPLTDS